MPNEDSSREKSLYHLLIVIARQINARRGSFDPNISAGLKSLEINRSDGFYLVTLKFKNEERRVSVPSETFRFYNTKSDDTVTQANRSAAKSIVLQILPELQTNNFQKSKKIPKIKINKLVTYFTVVTFEIFNLTNYKPTSLFALGLIFVYLPLWNFGSNYNQYLRTLFPLIPLFCLMAIGLRDVNITNIWVTQGLFIAGFFARVELNNRIKLINLTVGTIVLAGSIHNNALGSIFICLSSLSIELAVRKIYRKNPNMGLVAASILLGSAFLLSVLQYFKFNSFNFNFIVITILCIFIMYVLLVCDSGGGFIRVLIPLSLVCSGLSNGLIWVSLIAIAVLLLSKVLTPILDRASFE